MLMDDPQYYKDIAQMPYQQRTETVQPQLSGSAPPEEPVVQQQPTTQLEPAIPAQSETQTQTDQATTPAALNPMRQVMKVSMAELGAAVTGRAAKINSSVGNDHNEQARDRPSHKGLQAAFEVEHSHRNNHSNTDNSNPSPPRNPLINAELMSRLRLRVAEDGIKGNISNHIEPSTVPSTAPVRIRDNSATSQDPHSPYAHSIQPFSRVPYEVRLHDAPTVNSIPRPAVANQPDAQSFDESRLAQDRPTIAAASRRPSTLSRQTNSVAESVPSRKASIHMFYQEKHSAHPLPPPVKPRQANSSSAGTSSSHAGLNSAEQTNTHTDLAASQSAVSALRAKFEPSKSEQQAKPATEQAHPQPSVEHQPALHQQAVPSGLSKSADMAGMPTMMGYGPYSQVPPPAAQLFQQQHFGSFRSSLCSFSDFRGDGDLRTSRAFTR
jgi:hypothetical protein